MNEKICWTTNEGKTTKNEWENNESDFLWALYSVYEKLKQFFFHTYALTCLKKYTSELLKTYKYLIKLIS